MPDFITDPLMQESAPQTLTFDQLPAEAQAQFKAQESQKSGDIVDITPSPETLAEFLGKNKDGFTMEGWLSDPANRKRYDEDPALKQKIQAAYQLHDENIFRESMKGKSTKEAVKSTAEGIWGGVKGAGSMIWNLGRHGLSALSAIPQVVAAEALPLEPGYRSALLGEVSREQRERLAGTEASVMGFLGLPGKVKENALDMAKRATEEVQLEAATQRGNPEEILQTREAIYQDRLKRSSAKLERIADFERAQQERLAGRGGAAEAYIGAPAPGEPPVRPEVSAKFAEGEPLTFAAFGEALGGAGRLMKAARTGVGALEAESAEAALEAAKAKARIAGVKLPVTLREGVPAEFAKPAPLVEVLETPKAPKLEVPKIGEVPENVAPPVEIKTAAPEAAAARAKELGLGLEEQEAWARGVTKATSKAKRNLVDEGIIAENNARIQQLGQQIRQIQQAAQATPVATAAVAKASTAAKQALGVGAGALATAAAGTGELVGKAVNVILPPGINPRFVKLGTEGLTKIRQASADLTKQFWTAPPDMTQGARAIWDTLAVAGGAAKGAAKGFLTFDLPLTLLTAETPEERANPMLFGATLGALGGAGRGIRAYVRGQEIDESRWGGAAAPYKPYGKGNRFEAITDWMVKNEPQDPKAASEHQRQVNFLMAIREMNEPFGGEVHWLDRENFRKAIKEAGGTDKQGEARGVKLPDGTILLADIPVGPHEVGHKVQMAFPRAELEQMREDIRREYADHWDTAGQSLAAQWGGDPVARPWEYELVRLYGKEGVADTLNEAELKSEADKILADEIHADVIDTIQKTGRKDFTQAGGILGRTARYLASVAQFLGAEPYEGKKTPTHEFPVTRNLTEMIREDAARRVREARLGAKPEVAPAKPEVIPAKPEMIPAKAEPLEKAKAQALESLNKQTPSPQIEEAKKAVDAVGSDRGIEIVYLRAPGVEGGSGKTGVSRAERRSEVEAGRKLPNEEREAGLREDVFLTGIRRMPHGGKLQFEGFSRDILEKNIQRFTDWYGKLTPEQQAKLPLPFTLDAAGLARLHKQMQSYYYNHAHGFTGAGEPLSGVKPVAGYFLPETTGTPMKIPQREADFINMLHHFQIAGTPIKAPVVRGVSKLPYDLAAQRMAAQVAPERLGPTIRPKYGEQKAAKALGIEGETLQEVNPFRAEMAAITPLPELMEARRKFNVEHIKEIVGPAKGEPVFPNEMVGKMGFAAPKDEAKEYLRAAAIRNKKTGDLKTGSMHPWIRDEIAASYIKSQLPPGVRPEEILRAIPADRENYQKNLNAQAYAADESKFEEGYYTSKGRFVDRREALTIAREQGQLRREVPPERDWLDSDDLNITPQFAAPKRPEKAPEKTAEDLRKMGFDDLAGVKGYTTTAAHGTGGPTGLAYDIGLTTTTSEGLKRLAELRKEEADEYAEKFKTLREATDFDVAFKEIQATSTRGQLFREAAEAATGSGSAGDFLRKKGYTDEDFPLNGLKFAAGTALGKEKEKAGFEFRRTGGPGVRGVIVFKGGSPVGEVLSHVPSKSVKTPSGVPQDVWVDAVEVLKDFRGQALGKALYRELLDQLQKDGHKEVIGMVVAPEPIGIRETIFGPGKSRYYLNGEPVGLEEAIKAAETYKAGEVDENGEWKLPSIEVVSPIEEGMEFAAPKIATRAEEKRFAKYQVKPKKVTKATKWTLRPTGHEESKAWILPDGNPMMLGSAWHYKGLQQLGDQFGLDPKLLEGEGRAREAALTKGFVRVNYSPNGGALTFELRAADLKPQRAAIENLVEENLDKVDRFRVELFNRDATEVVDEIDEPIFTQKTEFGKSQAVMEALDNLRTGGELRFAAEKSEERRPKGMEDDEWDDLMQLEADSYFSKGHGDLESGPTKDRVWIWNTQTRGIEQDNGYRTHGSRWSHAVADRTFKGRYDAEQKIITVVFPERELEKLDKSSVTVDDIPTSVYDALRRTWPKSKFDVYPKTLDELRELEFAAQKKDEGQGELLSTREVSEMSQAAKRKRYPEAIVPKDDEEEIHYGIVDSPLYKKFETESAAAEAFAKRLIKFAREYSNTKEWKQGATWYSRFVPMLKEEFGEDAPVFAQLLAATSPQTGVKSNFGFAWEAFHNFKDGKYDKQVAKFLEGMNKLEDGTWKEWTTNHDLLEASPEGFLEAWIKEYDLKPRQTNGKLFGAHSARLLQVLSGVWARENKGLKTSTFVLNLLGQSHEATIDLWAARTMRWAGYEGEQDRWRILPANERAVTDEDFYFSQEVMRRAAKKLGMKPDALQGALWFAEKMRWAKKGWARLELGDFVKELQRKQAQVEEPGLFD